DAHSGFRSPQAAAHARLWIRLLAGFTIAHERQTVRKCVNQQLADARLALPVVSLDQPSKPTQDRAFFVSATTGLRSCGVDAAGQSAERKRLEPYSAGSAQCRKEQAFAAKERRLDLADKLNVVIHRGLKAHNAAGVHTEDFARAKIALEHCSPCMHKSQAIALQALQNETSAAEEPDAKAPREGDSHTDALGCAKKRFLLGQQLATNFAQINRQDFSWVGGGKGGSFF